MPEFAGSQFKKNFIFSLSKISKFTAGLVEFAVKTRLNLNVLSLIQSYKGPVKLIRRTNDEIISTM